VPLGGIVARWSSKALEALKILQPEALAHWHRAGLRV
jgi:hypothetical protein